MAIFIVFVLAGAGIIALTLAKRHELRHKRATIILDIVSKGDEHFRRVSHQVIHVYANGRHRTRFFLTKQLPLKVKIQFNKLLNYLREMSEERFGNRRGSREISKPENVSDFLKTIAGVEKGAGVLHEDYPHTHGPVVEVMARESIVVVPPNVTQAPASRKRAPRKKKLEVIEML